MREYNFFFNDNDELLCEIIDNSEKTELMGNDAINELISINDLKINIVNELILTIFFIRCIR